MDRIQTKPIPTPYENEAQPEFIGRCMADPVMVAEYPDESQRMAVCSAQIDKQAKVFEAKELLRVKELQIKENEITHR